MSRADIGELLISGIAAALYWPSLTPTYWRESPDLVAAAIATILEVTALLTLLWVAIKNLT